MYRISIGKRYDSGTDYVYKSFIHQKLVAHTHRKTHKKNWLTDFKLGISGGATPGRARSNDLAGRSTALA